MKDLLLKPLEYLYIEWAIDDLNGKNRKPIFDWYLPIVCSSLVTIFFYFTYSESLSQFKIFFESKGFEVLGNFILALPGFLFAALTAVVSFGNKELDITAKVNPPINGDGHEISRRRYLANAFSYLTFLSLFLLFVTIFINYCSVHDKFHRTLILSGFCFLKIAKISLNSSFFPKPIKR
jgi:hypothetical protein